MQLQAEAAQQHAAGRIALANGANLLVQQAWSGVDPAAIVDSWTAQVPVAAAAITRAQYAAASTSDPYIDEFDLAGAGVEDNLVPAAFAGTASDGRSLLSLLMSPAFQALQFIAAGSHPVDALRLGGQHLGVITQTQVADAGRLADGVALTAHRRIDGYIRVVAGGACSRCAILSGKWYRWSAGFLRHPHCHCVHEPANRDVDVPSPRALYDRMSPAERSRAGWSKADQRAIDDGADLAQVTNAKRGVYTAGGKRFTTAGTTRRGLYGGYRIDPETGRLTRRARGDKAGPRMTPEQIYREASGDRDRAIRMLRENGYLTPARPALAPVGAGGAAAAASPEIAVRAALRVDSAGAVEAAFAAEARRITGREITADFAGWSVETAREHAEGVLRGLEVFPDARLDHVGPIRGIVYGSRFAEAGDGSIDFNPRWVTEDAREEYLDTLRKSAVLPDGVTRGGIPDTPAGVAIHEFGHIVDLDTLGGRIQGDVYAAVYREAAAAGVDGDVLVRERLSQYATQSVEETVAEAFADVVINGERASALSREVFDLLEAEYRRGGFAAGSGIARAFGPAEDLSRLTVVQLRALAREREVRIPSTARKADIVELLQPAGGGQIRRGIERQREIDAVSPVAERAIAVEQFIHDGGSLADAADLLDVEAEHDATIAKMLAAVRKPGTTPAAAIREIRRLAGTRGLKPISRAGASVGFNPAEHRSLGRAEIAKGARVQVVQPGYAVTLASGERVILERAVVAESTTTAALTVTQARRLLAFEKQVDALIDYGVRALEPGVGDFIVRQAAADLKVPDAVRDAVIRSMASRDIAALRTAMKAELRKAGLVELDKAGARVRFDPALHRVAAGTKPAAGAEVRIVDPALGIRRGGDTVPVAKARVERVDVARQMTADEARIVRLVDTPEVDRRPLGGGATGETSLIRYEGGATLVRKYLGPRASEVRKVADQIAAEELGPLVLRAVGLDAATTVAVDRAIYMEHIAGTVGDQLVPWASGVPVEILDSAQGRLLGVADHLMEQGDRNPGNWIRTASGQLVGIDHGFAFQGENFSPFAEHLAATGQMGTVLSAGQVREIRDRLAALEPEFRRRGRLTWFRRMMKHMKDFA